MGCILYTIIQALPLNGFHLLFFSPLCSRSALLLFCADPQRRFRLQSLQAIGPEASAKGGAWNLAWAWRMVKKTTGLAQGKTDICKKSSFSPTKKRCFNCRFSVPKPLILDMAAMTQLWSPRPGCSDIVNLVLGFKNYQLAYKWDITYTHVCVYIS